MACGQFPPSHLTKDGLDALDFVSQSLPFLMAASLLRCRLLPVFFTNTFSCSWLSGKESACSAGSSRDAGSIPGSGRSPGGGQGNPLQYSCLENPHGQRSLEGYSPWGHKELDTAEQPNNNQHAVQHEIQHGELHLTSDLATYKYYWTTSVFQRASRQLLSSEHVINCL